MNETIKRLLILLISQDEAGSVHQPDKGKIIQRLEKINVLIASGRVPNQGSISSKFSEIQSSSNPFGQ
jgi:hypothetical protein